MILILQTIVESFVVVVKLGVKISKMDKYEQMFDGTNLPEDITNMILPISFGNQTISITVGTLIHLMQQQDDDQDIKIDANTQLILQNTELINSLSDEIYQRIQQLQEEAEAKHQQMIDDQNVIDTEQNERIGDIEATNLWEIYGTE